MNEKNFRTIGATGHATEERQQEDFYATQPEALNGVNELNCLALAIERICPCYQEDIEREYNHIVAEEILTMKIIKLEDELKERSK